MEKQLLNVEVVCALPEQQEMIACTVAPGTNALEVIRLSGIFARFSDLPPALAALEYGVGVWGVLLADPASYQVQCGDRIEIYRPLIINPMAARRQRAQNLPAGRVVNKQLRATK